MGDVFKQRYRKRPDTPALMPHDVYEGLNSAFKARGNCKVVTDVGQHQMWAAQYYHFEQPYRFITSGGAGTMGFGINTGSAVLATGRTMGVARAVISTPWFRVDAPFRLKRMKPVA